MPGKKLSSSCWLPSREAVLQAAAMNHQDQTGVWAPPAAPLPHQEGYGELAFESSGKVLVFPYSFVPEQMSFTLFQPA